MDDTSALLPRIWTNAQDIISGYTFSCYTSLLLIQIDDQIHSGFQGGLLERTTSDNHMPITLPDTHFNQILSREVPNRDDTSAFLAGETRVFTLPGFIVPFGYALYVCPEDKQYRLVTEEPRPETVYAVRLEETEDFTSPLRACIQIMVWRTRQPQHEQAVHGLARRFFCYFLRTRSIIVTDSAQTNAAKVMWESMIAWALRDRDHYVYIWDGTRSDRPLIPVSDWHAFCEYWITFCWGSQPDSHLLRRVIISTLPLAPENPGQ